MLYAKLLLTYVLIVSLAGCATVPGTEPPPARCMVSPKPLGDVKEGDDIIQKHAELRRDYGREAGKLRCMQGYSRALLGKN
jgi:hypothetical protein